MAAYLIEFQDKMANTLQKVQKQSFIDLYMTYLKSCTGHSSEEFNFLYLSFENVSKLTGNDLKGIFFVKAEGNLLNFLYLLALHNFLWNSLKGKCKQNFLK